MELTLTSVNRMVVLLGTKYTDKQLIHIMLFCCMCFASELVESLPSRPIKDYMLPPLLWPDDTIVETCQNTYIKMTFALWCKHRIRTTFNTYHAPSSMLFLVYSTPPEIPRHTRGGPISNKKTWKKRGTGTSARRFLVGCLTGHNGTLSFRW